MENKIRNLIKEKQTKICLAADLDNIDDIIKLVELVGDKICILKLHYDIIHDFYNNINNINNINKLKELKNKYNFLIWEDSKFADIGYIIKKKINNHISSWADLISIHPIAGEESVMAIENMGVILIGEMSSKNNLFNLEYQNKVIEISEKCDNVVGIVCQHKMTDKLNITPGISLKETNDNLGQQYSNPKNKQFSDILVIGRAIYNSKNPKKIMNELLNKIE